MIEDFSVRAESGCTAGQDLIHVCNFGGNLGHDLLRGKSPRLRGRRRFPPGREIAEADHDKSLHALLQSRYGSLGLAGFEEALKSFCGSGVAEIEVLKNLSGTPLLLRMPV